MSNLKWIFDGISASGKKSGGDSFVERLNSSKLNPAELFIRETVSNSADQRKEGTSHPVKVFIDVITLHGEQKEKFKTALNWDNLSKHAKAAAIDPQNEELHNRIHTSLKKFNSKTQGGTIKLVRISDYNANGLMGNEDEEDKNFFLFAKAQLLSSDDKNTQGSFGLGKGVLYHSSNLRTVLMSSSVQSDGKMMTRVFGRCELPHHDYCENGTKDWNPRQEWDGSGFFGVSSGNSTPRAESTFDTSKTILEDLFLDRDPELGTGTTALCVDFNSSEEGYSLAKHLEENVRRWFWPAIAQTENEAVQIYIREFNNSNCMTLGDGKVQLNEIYKPWADVLIENQNSNNLIDAGSIMQSEIKTPIPEDNAGSSKFEGIGDIKIINANIDSSLANTIALLRNKLCVLRYEKIIKPDEINGNLFGVYLAGFARPVMTPDDESFHQFLRLAEPALHDDWTEIVKIRHIYNLRAPQPFLRDHKNKIHAEVRNMLADESAPKKTNHDHLSSKFQFGPKGDGGKTKSVNFNCIDQKISNNFFEVTLKIRSLIVLEENWFPLCTLQIKGYNGIFCITDVHIKEDSYQNKIKYVTTKNLCSLDVAHDIETFEVKLIAEIPKDLLQKNSKGQKINLEELTYSIDVTTRGKS